MAKIKSNLLTPADMCTHREHPMKIKRQALHDISSSHVMCQNLSAPSSIKQTRLNGNDSHPKISSESLIED